MLLAIDTATMRASIALHDGATLLGECTWEAADRHTVTLLPHINSMLETSGLTPAALTALAVCIGPGSYTGVRIGVAAAKGLATARALPLVGIPTFEILVAAQPPDPRPLYAVFAAGRRRLGYACYRWREIHWQAETPVAVGTPAELAALMVEPALVLGEVDAQTRATLLALGAPVEFPPAARHLRRAGYLAELAWQRLRAGEQDDVAQLAPLYVK